MRLTDTEKGPFYEMREVSDLRTQYQCEYRLHLKRRFGEVHSSASVTGNMLHQQVSNKSEEQHLERMERNLLPLMIILLTLIVGFMWILW